MDCINLTHDHPETLQGKVYWYYQLLKRKDKQNQTTIYQHISTGHSQLPPLNKHEYTHFNTLYISSLTKHFNTLKSTSSEDCIVPVSNVMAI